MPSDLVQNHLRHIAKQEAKFGADSEEVAVALNTLARLICQYQEAADAVPYFERSIAIREALKGPESILAALDDWIDKNSFELTEPFLLKRLAIEAGILGEVDPRIADQCDGIAARYHDQKRWHEARTFLERSLAIRERLNGADSAEVAVALEALVEVCLRSRERELADQYLERCIKTLERLFGPSSGEVAAALVSLAVVYVNSSTLQHRGIKADAKSKSRPMIVRALSIKEDLFGPDSLEVRKALEATARSYLDCGEFSEAEPLLKRLLSISERVYGDDAAALLWILVELADGYAKKRSALAEPVMKRAFAVMRTLLDARNPTSHWEMTDAPGNRTILYSPRTGLLERLIVASERVRSNLRRRWGAGY
ncbi:tetratricopeptide repeat protein [Bradyrhizobium sp. LjRoot220]|uniref:tetratricopeptide repeat protein n=1 Tax=Bradyrhizobium sp. LjRoot220 TaxID=3342284 RepID=UPI003ECC92CB